MKSLVIQGPWMRAPNLSADAVGSIHDDSRARSLGFQAALVGGSVLCSFFESTLVDLFGKEWYERGFFKQSFVRPVYEVDEFRVVAEETTPLSTDDRVFAIGLEKRDGERATAGYAGLARAGSSATPWEREPVPQARDDGDPLPEQPLGYEYPLRVLAPTPAASAARRTASRNQNSWFESASPWGQPVVPSFMYILLDALVDREARPREERRQGRTQAGMNGTFQLRMYRPMLSGQRYELASRLVEKGFSGRTAYRTLENRITGAGGEIVAIARQKVRWFADQS